MRTMRESLLIGLVSSLITGFIVVGYMDKQEDHVPALTEKIDELELKLLDLEIKYNDELSNIQSFIIPKRLTVTAYSASVDECNSDPNITASMQKVRPGIIAVSRDLFEQGWVFGKKVYIEKVGIYEIADLMNAKHENRIDVFIGHKSKAKEFGKKDLLVALLPD